VTKVMELVGKQESAARQLAETFSAQTLDSLIRDAVKSGDLLTFPWVWFHAARPGSAGRRPPRLSMAMAIIASGL